MSWLGNLYRNLRSREHVEHQLDDELRAYVELLAEEKIRAGIPAAEARRQALIEAGGLEQVKEQVRDIRTGHWLSCRWQDLRISARGLAHNRAFTAFCVFMQMLGIGATTLVFSVFYSVLLQPLPYRDINRLVEVWETRLDRGWTQASFAEGNFWDARSLNRSFSEMAAISWGSANISKSDRPEHVSRGNVSAGFFRVLGVAPALGRDFTYTEDRPGENNRVILLSDKLWRKSFAADPRAVGSNLRIDGAPHTIIGVLPPGRPWLDAADLFAPMVFQPNGSRGSFELNTIARLAPGVTLAAAQADLERVSATIASQFPQAAKGIGMNVKPASGWIANGQTRQALWVLLGAVGLLLLIACVNLANLLLARAAGRVREMAIRSALGATRARLAALTLAESCLLCLAGASLGLLFAYVGLQLLGSSTAVSLPAKGEVHLSAPVLIATLVLTIATGLLSGLASALQAPATVFSAALREGGRNETGAGRGTARLRNILVAGEVALSIMLLIGAGLLIRSFVRLNQTQLGFDSQQRMFFSVNLPNSIPGEQRSQLITGYLDRINALPYVKSAAIVSQRPLQPGDTGMGFGAPGFVETAGQVPWASWRLVSPRYFEAMGVRLLAGRTFLPAEEANPKANAAVVVSQSVARLLYPNQDPLGRTITMWKGQANRQARIVGVVADMRERNLETQPPPVVYLPATRISWQAWDFVVHTANPPLAAVPTLRSLLASINATLPLYDVSTMEEMVSQSAAPRRLQTLLLGLFAALALLLAVSGVYGVLSYWLNRRQAEMGLRVALGARPAEILRVTVMQGMKPVMAGIVLGLAGAAMLGRYLETLLFEIKPSDPLTYAVVTVLVAAIALAACLVPGWRAARVDPAIALRAD